MIPGVGSAALWGALAAVSLIIGAFIAVRLKPSERVTGAIMGFGAGALIGSIAYELVPDSTMSTAGWDAIFAFAGGALTFFVGDWIIDSRGGRHRKRIAAASDGGSGRAIFLGTLLDGIPESVVLGIGLALGSAGTEPSINIAFLVAVFVSNVPEAIAGTSSMVSEGHSVRQVYVMWVLLVVAAGLAAGAGFAFARVVPSIDGLVAQAFAAGAMLTMLADTMMPEALRHGGKVVGLLTTLGFLLAAILSALE